MNKNTEAPDDLEELEAASEVLDKHAAQEQNLSATQELRPNIPKERPLLERIGNVALDTTGGVFSGCKLMKFKDEEELNNYFRDNANVMLVSWHLDGNYGALYCFVTNTLDADQLEVIKMRTEVIEAEVNKLKEARDAERAAEEAKQHEAVEESLRLAKVGEHCEKSHGSVIKQMRAKKKGK